nr:immunoglobulin heavy chain junction region [Mus musculus]NSM06965.1 immunoglobulin heavy chain junction region [Mus musculus]NSM08842.1 immunoglobulin heavy chain junction region [Mus musculus]
CAVYYGNYFYAMDYW